MTIDLLACFAHPDDAELLAGGTLIRAVTQGHNVAALDLTRGELGSKGTPELRAKESQRAAELMGLASRESLGLPDGHLKNDDAMRRMVVEAIRRLRPRVVITHYPTGRHPDHRRASELVRDSCFLAGLVNYPGEGEKHRPAKVLHAMGYREDPVKPTFVVDTSASFERKLEALHCYDSQWDGNTRQGGELYPTGQQFFDLVRTQDAHAGSLIRAAYGERFWTSETLAVADVVTMGVASV